MTGPEFDLIDALYFISDLPSLERELGWTPDEIWTVLEACYQKGWVKIVSLHDGKDVAQTIQWTQKPTGYHFLASKEGLLAHNGGG